MRWAGNVTHVGGDERCFQNFDRRLREDLGVGGGHNIKMAFREIGSEGVDWILLGQEGTVAGSCEHGNELPGSIKGGKFFDCQSDSFSRMALFHGVSFSSSDDIASNDMGTLL
jgi:hypothetical protein